MQKRTKTLLLCNSRRKRELYASSRELKIKNLALRSESKTLARTNAVKRRRKLSRFT